MDWRSIISNGPPLGKFFQVLDKALFWLMADEVSGVLEFELGFNVSNRIP